MKNETFIPRNNELFTGNKLFLNFFINSKHSSSICCNYNNHVPFLTLLQMTQYATAVSNSRRNKRYTF